MVFALPKNKIFFLDALQHFCYIYFATQRCGKSEINTSTGVLK